MKNIAFSNKNYILKIFLLFIGIFCSLQIAAQNNLQNDQKILKHKFNTSNGKITVFLPAQISSGDVISGKVIYKPSGNNDKKRQKNANIFNGYFIELGENKSSMPDGLRGFHITDKIEQNISELLIRNEKGNIIGKFQIPVSANPPFVFPFNSAENFSPILPEFVNSGAPVSIIGQFDGDYSNTTLQLANQEIEILAESPRELLFNCPDNISGFNDISITEKKQTFESEIRIIDLQLSASKTKLKTGEQTKVQILVSGLEGLNSELRVDINNLTPAVLLLEGGNHQNILITPENVNNGIWNGIISGQSIRNGDFSVQVRIEPPPQSFIIPVYPVGEIEPEKEIGFTWNPINIPENTFYDLLISMQSGNKKEVLIHELKAINQNPFIFPNELPLLKPGEVYVWQVQTVSPFSGTISSPSLSWQFGPVAPQDNPPGPGDPCEDPKYVENEEKQCADIVDEKVNKPFHTGPDLDFDNFKDDWQEHFRLLSQTMLQFDLQLSMIKYWIGAGDEIDKQAQDIQKIAGLIKDGIGKGVKAFKEGGEEVMKDMAQEYAEDKVKEFEQYAVGQVSETLGALYDLEDLAIRRVGLGIAKGITGVYPDKKADNYRRQLQISTTELSGWVCNWQNQGVKDQHPTLQDGIAKMCDYLNQLDQIEEDFEKAVEAAGFICIECEIPEWLREEIEKLRQDIETHIRMFGDTIDQIRQRLVEARGIANNKKAYEDIARLGSFQGNSAKQTQNINRVLKDSKIEFENALNRRKQ